MFTAALFSIPKHGGNQSAPLIDEWIKKISYILLILPRHKKNEILPFVTTWIDPEGIMLSEISQTNTV